MMVKIRAAFLGCMLAAICPASQAETIRMELPAVHSQYIDLGPDTLWVESIAFSIAGYSVTGRYACLEFDHYSSEWVTLYEHDVQNTVGLRVYNDVSSFWCLSVPIDLPNMDTFVVENEQLLISRPFLCGGVLQVELLYGPEIGFYLQCTEPDPWDRRVADTRPGTVEFNTPLDLVIETSEMVPVDRPSWGGAKAKYR